MATSASQSELQLIAKPGAKSLAWEYFGLERGRSGQPTDTDTAICRSCHRRVAAKNGNTSNLLAHLRTHHAKTYSEVNQAMKGKQPWRSSKSRSSHLSVSVGQSTIQETLERSQKYDRTGKKWKEITDAITHYIARDSLPVYTVEKLGFRRLMETLDRRYEIPSRSYFSKTAIPSLYAATVDKVKEELSSVQYYASTTDLWSSHGMIPYLSYTVHFIDSFWKLRSRCLQTQFLPHDHTGEHLAEAMECTLDSWGLPKEKQVCLTTDNASNIVNAAERLKWTRFSCFGHNLHLAITHSIKHDQRCSRAIGVCHKIVSAFSQSWKRKRELSKAQIHLGLEQHALVAVSIHYTPI